MHLAEQAFEFSPRYLLLLADAAYSKCFVEFLGNCTKQRRVIRLAHGFLPCSSSRGKRPISIWTYIETLLEVSEIPFLQKIPQWIRHLTEVSNDVMVYQEEPRSDLRNPLYRGSSRSSPSCTDLLLPCTDTQALKPWRDLYARDLPRLRATIDRSHHDLLEEVAMADTALLDWIGEPTFMIIGRKSIAC